jgi:predicted DNA-binding WGR domain protein
MQIWYLEFSDSSSHKFYEVTLEDSTLTIRYGRIGDAGQSSKKTFDTPEKALAEVEKKLKEKRKSGYLDATIGEREKKAVIWEKTVPKLKIVGFEEVEIPVTEPITKFGGQPVWIAEPKWPICPKNQKEIPFLCQIYLDPDFFGDIPNKMAYIFAGDYKGDGGAGGWPTDHGDCAIVLQPENTVWWGWHWNRETKPENLSSIATGPTIYRGVNEGTYRWQGKSLEWIPKLQLEYDYDFVLEDKRETWSEKRQEEYSGTVSDNKIGGTPHLWFENEPNQAFMLLLQLNASDGGNPELPFMISYGDGGCGWWFLSKDGRSAQYQDACY